MTRRKGSPLQDSTPASRRKGQPSSPAGERCRPSAGRRGLPAHARRSPAPVPSPALPPLGSGPGRCAPAGCFSGRPGPASCLRRATSTARRVRGRRGALSKGAEDTGRKWDTQGWAVSARRSHRACVTGVTAPRTANHTLHIARPELELNHRG